MRKESNNNLATAVSARPETIFSKGNGGAEARRALGDVGGGYAAPRVGWVYLLCLRFIPGSWRGV